MKKLSLTFLIAAIVFTIAISVSANYSSVDSFVEEDEFVLAGFNGTKSYAINDPKAMELEDSVWWLVDKKDTLNLKYAFALGQIACDSNYHQGNTLNKGMTTDEMLNLCATDSKWKKEFSRLYNALSPLTDENIPFGVNFDVFDYAANGYSRQSMQSDFFAIDKVVPEDVTVEYLDDANYYVVIENNGVEYMIFQLELFPRTATLTWFNSVLEANKDKRAIVFTTSFIDDNADMYTMWNWETDSIPPLFGTTYLRKYSLTWVGKPRDGEQAWLYSFANYDNILAIFSSKITVDGIITTKFTNDRGVETAAIASNAENGMYTKYGNVVFLAKISDDNKTITCAYASPQNGIINNTVTTVKIDSLGELAEPTVKANLPKVSPQYNGANKAYIFGKGANKFDPQANMTRAEACTIFARLILGKDTIPDGYTTRFTDVKTSDWFYNAVAFLDQTGFFFRNTSTTYKPNEPITRAEFVDLANAASTLAQKDEVYFKDVTSEHFYYDSIMAAARSGLVNGYEDNTFRPDATITRAEVVTVINRLLGLKVDETTVSLSNIENEFNDIGSHWARLNILMASNNNVHGDYYYSASLNGVEETSSEYKFTNKHFSISVNKKNGKVTEIINLYTNENIFKNSSAPQFIYVTNEIGNTLVPKKLSTEGNRIKVEFKDECVVYLIVNVQDDFMTFEIDSHLPSSYKSVTFANLNTNIVTNAEDDESFMLNAIGMSAWTNPVNKGFRANATSTIAHAYTQFDTGTMGAKLGVVFSKRGDAIPLLQKLTDTIDPSVGLKSTKGGAYAQEYEGNFGDYMFADGTAPETVDYTIKMAKLLDIDQIDIHQGATAFRQGDFYFYNTESGTAKEYYEKIGSKFAEAGFETGLHTYAYYINGSCVDLVTNPKWQKDLAVSEVFTLRKDVSKFRVNFPTEEDVSGYTTFTQFFGTNTNYFLIDEEIVRVTSNGTTSGFINVVRGQLGTEEAQHKAGAKIYHLEGYFNLLCPKLGSDLFYHVADLTAKAYNDGGFSMLYFDAIDGLSAHVETTEETYYYFQMFVHRVVSQCKIDPILETSSSAPQEWNVRARTGAWDTPSRGIKQFIANHVEVNKSTHGSNMTSTLGWFDFCPDLAPLTGLKNTFEKTLFHDDLDFIGVNALVYNMSMVYNNDLVDIETSPYLYDNCMYYIDTYSKLRKSHYFTEETLEKVKENGNEFRVIEKADGEYAFLEMYYNKNNVGNYGDESLTFKGSNPFSSQTPFVRIESRYSTLSENEMVIFELDETKPLSEQTLNRNTSFDLSNNLALKFKVKGTGKDGDALLLSLTGNITFESSGRGDYFIDLNYDGWREYVLVDIDNAEYDIEKYTFSGIATNNYTYVTYRRGIKYADIINITVRGNNDSALSTQMSSICAYTQNEAPVKNPTVTVGNSKMTFNCTIKGGEYVEYDPITNKAILYHSAEQTKEEVSVSGKLTVPAGSYTCTYSGEAQTDAPLRAKVVFGFSGQEITNE